MVLKHRSPKEVAERIGREYVEYRELPEEGTRSTQEVYNQIAGIVVDLFAEIPVPVQFQKDDPYRDYADMAETVAEEQKLRVYNQHTDHPYFSHMEQLAFRAVHDWHGHLEADVDFTPEGEYKKFQHMQQYLNTAKQERVMFAEVVGQVGAVHYLPDGFADPDYEQRAFQSPIRWMRWMDDAVHGGEL